jgi:membrane protein YqaA with SNARE-associated domain
VEVIQSWLKMTAQQFVRAEQRFVKYGLVSLCFAWLPVSGDPLTLIAGVMRIRLLWFVLLVTAGKLLRYLVVSYLVMQAS